MSVRCVFGAQWGDEGKGKIIDLSGRRTPTVVGPLPGRCERGAHRWWCREENVRFALHLITVGDPAPGQDSTSSRTAWRSIRGRCSTASWRSCAPENGIEVEPGAPQVISDRAHVVMPFDGPMDRRARRPRGALEGGGAHRHDRARHRRPAVARQGLPLRRAGPVADLVDEERVPRASPARYLLLAREERQLARESVPTARRRSTLRWRSCERSLEHGRRLASASSATPATVVAGRAYARRPAASCFEAAQAASCSTSTTAPIRS